MMGAAQIRAARALLGISQRELSKIADVAISTVKRIELAAEITGSARTLWKLQSALENAGEPFDMHDFRSRIWGQPFEAAKGVRPTRLYDLRSTLASNALAAGITTRAGTDHGHVRREDRGALRRPDRYSTRRHPRPPRRVWVMNGARTESGVAGSGYSMRLAGVAQLVERRLPKP